jgi:GT2 family glycosyltransferase
VGISRVTQAKEMVEQEASSLDEGAFIRSVSVIIVSYWTGPILARSVMSALHQSEVCDVIVVDNGNPKEDLERLKTLAGEDAHRLKILTGHGNIGYAAACNHGARAADGKYIFILNPDAILPTGSVGKLLAATKDWEDDLWLIGGKLINPDGSEQAGSRRNALTPGSAFIEMTQIWRIAPKHPMFQRFNRHQTPCPKETVEMPVISGACMLMPRETFDAIGGMDERYFLHVEDVDFCLRLGQAGGVILFTPGAEILHYKSSSRANAMRIEYRKVRSIIIYFQTHFDDQYPKPFLWLVYGLAWLGFSFRFVKRAFARALGVIGLRRRRGVQALQRAKAMERKRADR